MTDYNTGKPEFFLFLLMTPVIFDDKFVAMYKPTALLALLLIAVPASSALARIGETRKQCVARYGKPLSVSDKGTLFVKGHMKIFVTFSEGKAESIWLQKTDPDVPTLAVPISKEEIDTFLAANSQGHQWRYNASLPDGDEVWITKDSELGALYSRSTLSLQVYTRDCIARR
jgi:hypothetical protein